MTLVLFAIEIISMETAFCDKQVFVYLKVSHVWVRKRERVGERVSERERDSKRGRECEGWCCSETK